MKVEITKGSIALNIEKIAKIVNILIPLLTVIFACLGYFFHWGFYLLGGFFLFSLILNFYYRHIQTEHTLLANFGVVALIRYFIESVGPEFRQYLFMSDIEEKPFSRNERAEVYKKSKGEDSTLSFGTHKDYAPSELKLRHSMFPTPKEKLKPFSLIFGEERQISQIYEMKSPIMISAMSYGALGQNAVRALARGAKKAGILMNTGEGGFPKYHLMEGVDLIFQLGTAKFGARNPDATLNEEKLREISKIPQIKMIEIKLSQGAKPGKGGLLPKEKITEEISELRGVPMGEDVHSPAYHVECINPEKTVKFIKRVQDISQLPIGIKLCLGLETEFNSLVEEMKKQDIFPDYMAIDGGEGGTGAAPQSFMDDVGLPIFEALPLVHRILTANGVRNKLKIIAAGKLINPGKQFMALSLGADAIYTARGFLLALGCIQALQCNRNSCPVGITTHNRELQKGLDIEEKSQRVESYIYGLTHDHEEILSSLGKINYKELNSENLYQEGIF